MSIRCGHCRQRHETVTEVKACSRPKPTLEQAKAYGRRTGRCMVCGRRLTHPASVAEGIGPVCSGRL
jgi:hypothetical protein